MRWDELMFPGGTKRALGIAEISEWFEWMRREIPKGGLALPPEETAALFAGNALRVRDRIKHIYRYHLPVALENQFIESALVYQCWRLAKYLYVTVKWPEARRTGSLATVEAERYIRPVGAKWGHHLVEGRDGFRYVVIVPTGYRSETVPATEVICNRLSRLLGLSVPDAAVVVVSARLLGLWRDARPGLGACPAVKATPKLCAGFRYVDSSPSDILPLTDQRLSSRNLRQLMGSLALDIWTLNLAERKWSTAFSRVTGRNELTLDGGVGCLSGGDWRRFLGAFATSEPAAQAIALDLRRWDQIRPWLRKIAALDMNPIFELVFQMPPEWYGGRRQMVMEVLDKLESRKCGLKSTVSALIRAGYFPAMRMAAAGVEVGAGTEASRRSA
jgi:hypothetical protein